MRWLLLSCALASTAWAKPYRAMVTHTASTTPGGHVEVGARYQAFILGVGRTGVNASNWHQVAASARWGIIDNLELDLQVEALIDWSPGRLANVFFGDLPLALHWTFLDRPKFALGVYGRVTFPTGPGHVDVLPPMLSDGTWDAELTVLGELRPSAWARFMVNAGFLYHHVRNRGPNAASFDVPEAVRWALAGTFNIGKRWLFSLEVLGLHFFRPDITPVWVNNQHLIEVIPGVRFEVIPRLVFEAGLGISVTPGLRELWQLRPLAGVTYEFG
ncbi:MAG: hypothetical protein JNK82_04735 [Myxococcaceae bacterium]|nr:hypothetical protein [Myxococcaceae bacterium]